VNHAVNHTVKHATSKSAFATMMALMLLAVVAAAIVALLGLLSLDAKTTARDADLTQLRQLLLAGAADAKQKLTAGADVPDRWTVATPSALASEIQVEPKSNGDTRDAIITARAGSRSLTQTIRFRRAGDRWEVESATLQE